MGADQRHFPQDRKPGAMKLPHGTNFSRIPVTKVKVFAPINGAMLQCFRYKGDNPELFLDLERPQESYKFMKNTELHIGVRGNFELEPIFESTVKKDRLDIYIPLAFLGEFVKGLLDLQALARMGET